MKKYQITLEVEVSDHITDEQAEEYFAYATNWSWSCRQNNPLLNEIHEVTDFKIESL